MTSRNLLRDIPVYPSIFIFVLIIIGRHVASFFSCLKKKQQKQLENEYLKWQRFHSKICRSRRLTNTTQHSYSNKSINEKRHNTKRNKTKQNAISISRKTAKPRYDVLNLIKITRFRARLSGRSSDATNVSNRLVILLADVISLFVINITHYSLDQLGFHVVCINHNKR